MKQKINLNKQAFSKTQYPRVINTEFTQLIPASTGSVAVEDVSVSEFFLLYDKLFFDIPKTGNNSHETLIQTSTEYIGYESYSAEIEALQQEISELRRQLLEERSSAVNTIADVLDEAGLSLPELPELPNLEVPSEFEVSFDESNLTLKEEKEGKKEEKKDKKEEKKEEIINYG